MNTKGLINLGVPRACIEEAKAACAAAGKARFEPDALRSRFKEVLAAPEAHSADPVFGPLARAIVERRSFMFVERESPAPWKQWGTDLDQASIAQIQRACRLPIAAAGALMPDAHVGYGLPNGGVLATENAVIPYAVGVDIACRVKITVLDMPVDALENKPQREHLRRALENQTRFGVGAEFTRPHDHEVLEDDWSVSPITQHNKRKAQNQLGTSGSGNHFVEFGVLEVGDPSERLETRGESGFGSGWSFDLAPGKYLALLSHSGSRGTGAAVCDHYSRIAMQQHRDLPDDLRHLAWLDLDSDAGREYWAAMNLMGRYASANHELIHRSIAKALGAKAIAHIENHHNFAWKEVHDPGDGRGPRELIVHRKGATPAGPGVLGVIPGSMASPTYVVRGLGQPQSLLSASHGAGRRMSRTQARESFRWSGVRPVLANANVEVLSAGIDENPGVYKDIDAVMAAQADLVEPVARFLPRIVKMAPEGEKAED